MLSFFVKYADGTRGTVHADTEFDAWTLPGVIFCQILGGQ